MKKKKIMKNEKLNNFILRETVEKLVALDNKFVSLKCSFFIKIKIKYLIFSNYYN